MKPCLAAQDGDRFVASHGGVARAFQTLIGGMDPAEAANRENRQGAALVFEGGGFSWIGG